MLHALLDPRPARFYLSDHTASNYDTPELRRLVSMSQRLVVEFGVLAFLQFVASSQPRWPNRIKIGNQSFAKHIFPEPVTRSSIDWDASYQLSASVFFNGSKSEQEAEQAMHRFWLKATPESKRREKATAKLILHNPEGALIIFGAGHPGLVELVSKHHPVNVYYPWKGYPASFDIALSERFRATGTIDHALYLKSMMESHIQMVIAALFTDAYHHRPEYRELFRLGNYYACLLDADHISAYRQRLLHPSPSDGLKSFEEAVQQLSEKCKSLANPSAQSQKDRRQKNLDAWSYLSSQFQDRQSKMHRVKAYRPRIQELYNQYLEHFVDPPSPETPPSSDTIPSSDASASSDTSTSSDMYSPNELRHFESELPRELPLVTLDFMRESIAPITELYRTHFERLVQECNLPRLAKARDLLSRHPGRRPDEVI